MNCDNYQHRKLMEHIDNEDCDLTEEEIKEYKEMQEESECDQALSMAGY